jgi:SAM-dependent methyltransferase
MDRLERSMDYDDPGIAEVYDISEAFTDDVDFLRRLLPGDDSLNILECFCGSGRILVPLAMDGHRVTGIDISTEMMARTEARLSREGSDVSRRVRLVTGDVLEVNWGGGFDVVLLGCNCLYELPSPESQEECIRRAHDALLPGGYLFLDSNDCSGHGASRDDVGTEWTGLEGTTPDGSRVSLSARVVEVDEDGVSRFVRTWRRELPDGSVESRDYMACKYPVCGSEIRVWLLRNGFRDLEVYQDTSGTPYSGVDTKRIIFWALRD